MKIYYSLLQFIFYIAQSQESWKTIYQEFTGSNWDASSNLTFNQDGTSLLPTLVHLASAEIRSYLEEIQFSVLIHQFLHNLLFLLIINYEYHQIYGIDSWDGEILKMVFDSEIRQRSFILTDGQQICGRIDPIFLEYNTPIVITVSYHNSKSVVIIMTSTLDQSEKDESWGFQNLQIEILECPPGCAFCSDSTSQCKFWKNVESYQFGKSTEEGWLIDGSQQITSSFCNGVRILGGINILQKGQGVVNLMESLVPHFKVQIMVKIWVIGEWQNEEFAFEIDGQLYDGITIVSDDFIYPNCQKQKVRILNVDVNTFHSSPSIKLSMKTSKNIEAIAHWGFQSTEMFIAICASRCQTCTGELDSQCVICLEPWIKINIGCIAPPLECSQIQIIEQQNKQVDLKNSFQINIDELAQNLGEIGQKTVTIDKLIYSINFQIQVRCSEQKIVQSFFRSCQQCYEDQYKLSNQCPNKSNILRYNAIFHQVMEQEKVLIITISESKLQILQVLSTEEESIQVLILQIQI
ncbi:unnamed protein product [Paramecium octaurelia]|uniref:Uncharacterized protein n=1 Tax=Paramecium octaurelia TaxID=43137 RepID=A0A8S1WIN1_PAROT|nr:unnamed protein product [Paramecium octaurelia]